MIGRNPTPTSSSLNLPSFGSPTKQRTCPSPTPDSPENKEFATMHALLISSSDEDDETELLSLPMSNRQWDSPKYREYAPHCQPFRQPAPYSRPRHSATTSANLSNTRKIARTRNCFKRVDMCLPVGGAHLPESQSQSTSSTHASSRGASRGVGCGNQPTPRTRRGRFGAGWFVPHDQLVPTLPLADNHFDLGNAWSREQHKWRSHGSSSKCPSHGHDEIISKMSLDHIIISQPYDKHGIAFLEIESIEAMFA